MRAAVLLLTAVGGAAAGQVRVDECGLDEDRCLRAALELRLAWDRCAAPRLVVDETSYSAGKRRLQGVWCDWGVNGSGVFHSAPVAWDWVAATTGRRDPSFFFRSDDEDDEALWRRRPPVDSPDWRTWKAQAEQARARALRAMRARLARVFTDGGPLSRLALRLRPAGSRMSAAAVLIAAGSTILVVERQPLGDLRPEDLPWGLLPWRPAWFFLPRLTREERELLSTATLVQLIKLPGEDACLRNELSGARLLSEGPAEQDHSVRAASCVELAEGLARAGQPAVSEVGAEPWLLLNGVAEAVGDALLAPVDRPRFRRQASPNADAFPVHKVP